MYKAPFFVHEVLPAEMEIPYLDSGRRHAGMTNAGTEIQEGESVGCYQL